MGSEAGEMGKKQVILRPEELVRVLRKAAFENYCKRETVAF